MKHEALVCCTRRWRNLPMKGRGRRRIASYMPRVEAYFSLSTNRLLKDEG